MCLRHRHVVGILVFTQVFLIICWHLDIEKKEATKPNIHSRTALISCYWEVYLLKVVDTHKILRNVKLQQCIIYNYNLNSDFRQQRI